MQVHSNKVAITICIIFGLTGFFNKIWSSNGVERGGHPVGLINQYSRILCEFPIDANQTNDHKIALLSSWFQSSSRDPELTIDMIGAMYVQDQKIVKITQQLQIKLKIVSITQDDPKITESAYEKSGQAFFKGLAPDGIKDALLESWLGDTNLLPPLLKREVYQPFWAKVEHLSGKLPPDLVISDNNSLRCNRLDWYIPLLKTDDLQLQGDLFDRIEKQIILGADFYFTFMSLWYMRLEALADLKSQADLSKFEDHLEQSHQMLRQQRETIKRLIPDMEKEFELHPNFKIYMNHYLKILSKTDKFIKALK